MADTFDLQRFLDAQAPVYERVLAELRVGDKQSHWMWFIFPQIAGLGHSPMAQRYAIASLDESRAYLAHPVLGARLVECAELVNAVEGKTVGEIFGYPDDLKFRSSLTLFLAASPGHPTFQRALDQYFVGVADPRTLEMLENGD